MEQETDQLGASQSASEVAPGWRGVAQPMMPDSIPQDQFYSMSSAQLSRALDLMLPESTARLREAEGAAAGLPVSSGAVARIQLSGLRNPIVVLRFGPSVKLRTILPAHRLFTNRKAGQIGTPESG